MRFSKEQSVDVVTIARLRLSFFPVRMWQWGIPKLHRFIGTNPEPDAVLQGYAAAKMAHKGLKPRDYGWAIAFPMFSIRWS